MKENSRALPQLISSRDKRIHFSPVTKDSLPSCSTSSHDGGKPRSGIHECVLS